MRDVIRPVRKLMEAGGQDYPDTDTATLYMKLVKEEFQELLDAEAEGNEVKMLDAVADLIWVTTGLALAKGWLLRSAWEEVARSNLSKIDPETGKVLKREDGKILKPKSYSPPDLEKFLK